MPEHTPGPWRIVRSLDRLNPNDVGIACDGIQTVLAECYAEFHARGDIRPAEALANARLIAVAPELLAACQRATPWLGKMIADGGHLAAVLPQDAVRSLEMLEAAIAKATGKE